MSVPGGEDMFKQGLGMDPLKLGRSQTLECDMKEGFATLSERADWAADTLSELSTLLDDQKSELVRIERNVAEHVGRLTARIIEQRGEVDRSIQNLGEQMDQRSKIVDEQIGEIREHLRKVQIGHNDLADEFNRSREWGDEVTELLKMQNERLSGLSRSILGIVAVAVAYAIGRRHGG